METRSQTRKYSFTLLWITVQYEVTVRWVIISPFQSALWRGSQEHYGYWLSTFVADKYWLIASHHHHENTNLVTAGSQLLMQIQINVQEPKISSKNSTRWPQEYCKMWGRDVDIILLHIFAVKWNNTFLWDTNYI